MSETPALFFAGQPGTNFGWGVCNRHLLSELSKLTRVTALTESDPRWRSRNLPGPLFTPLIDHHLAPTTPARGAASFGYTFFEQELAGDSVANARAYDRVFAGSTWCLERLHEKGITHAEVLIQGVDTTVFHPAAAREDDGRFIIFSGGKFELRKGQDLVLRAFAVLHRKYPDLMPVNAWANQWPYSLATMAAAPGFRFELRAGSWPEQASHLCEVNGIDPSRVHVLPLLPQEELAPVCQRSDLGLFPNRCEGGTNLVLMEFMACGKPVIATHATGHGDVLNDQNALLLRQNRPLEITNQRGELTARWVEPSLDEIIAQVEFAYHHREATARLGRQAAADMREWSWERAARTALHAIHRA